MLIGLVKRVVVVVLSGFLSVGAISLAYAAGHNDSSKGEQFAQAITGKAGDAAIGSTAASSAATMATSAKN